uniref:Putative secreted protein n=1 Tax=Anopheles darlingi TaxID=43151 RepID=A0A2M4DDE9_ANODA
MNVLFVWVVGERFFSLFCLLWLGVESCRGSSAFSSVLTLQDQGRMYVGLKVCFHYFISADQLRYTVSNGCDGEVILHRTGQGQRLCLGTGISVNSG